MAHQHCISLTVKVLLVSLLSNVKQAEYTCTISAEFASFIKSTLSHKAGVDNVVLQAASVMQRSPMSYILLI